MLEYAGAMLWQRLGAICAVAASVLLAGCFAPLYGDRSATGGSSVRESLSTIEIAQIPAAGPSLPRVAVGLQNELRFLTTGGGTPPKPAYRLVTKIAIGLLSVPVTTVSGLPVNENYNLIATYSLVEIATGRPVLTASATTVVTYDPAGRQRFARVSGQWNAEDRAVKVVAQQIATRLSSYFVSGS